VIDDDSRAEVPTEDDEPRCPDTDEAPHPPENGAEPVPATPPDDFADDSDALPYWLYPD
jgi:hypothetical protein